MKSLFSLLLPLLLFANQPTWFYDIENKNSELIGYGVSKDLYEAKKYAIDEIAKKIDVKVDSITKISKSLNNNQYERKISKNINIQSNINLSSIDFIKTELIDDKWYVAASYKRVLLQDKIKAKLSEYDFKDTVQNNYLKQSPLIELLNKYLNKKIDYNIVLQDGVWNIKYGKYLTVLNQEEFYELFYMKKDKKIDLETNKKSYENQDSIQFRITNQKEGYFTLFDVDYSGKVGIIFPNKHSLEPFIYPKDKSLKITNTLNKPIKELFILIYSKEPLNLSLFENIDTKLLDTNSLKFHKLIDFLDNKTFVSTTINLSKGY